MLLRKSTNTIIILSLLSLSRMSLAAIYYVDPKGDDNNDGSQNNPFATIQKAIDEANDGTSTNYDVVHVNSGTYTTGPIILSNDNQRIEFAPNVIVQARSISDPNDPKDSTDSNSFRYPFAVLFKAQNKSNITFDGNNTVFRMRKSEYPPHVPFDTDNVNLSTDQITIINHRLRVGDAVRYYYGSDKNAVFPLVLYHWYYAIVVDADTIQLALSFQDASNAAEIDLTSKPVSSQTHNLHGGEWRQVIKIVSSNNVEISGITCKDSGGCGIEINRDPSRLKQQYCKDIKINNVTCDNSLLFGIVITSVDGLTIEHSVFKNNHGLYGGKLDYGIGIDFETQRKTDKLSNIIIRNCLIENNGRGGINLSANALDNSSQDISLLVEDCNIVGAIGSYSCISVQNVKNDRPGGLIKFKNTTVRRARFPIIVKDKASESASVVFEGCTISDVNGTPAASHKYPIKIRNNNVVEKLGGIKFINCQVYDNEDRPAIKTSGSPSNLYEIHGDLYIQNTARSGGWYDWENAKLHHVDLTFHSGLAGSDSNSAEHTRNYIK